MQENLNYSVIIFNVFKNELYWFICDHFFSACTPFNSMYKATALAKWFCASFYVN